MSIYPGTFSQCAARCCSFQSLHKIHYREVPSAAIILCCLPMSTREEEYTRYIPSVVFSSLTMQSHTRDVIPAAKCKVMVRQTNISVLRICCYLMTYNKNQNQLYWPCIRTYTYKEFDSVFSFALNVQKETNKQKGQGQQSRTRWSKHWTTMYKYEYKYICKSMYCIYKHKTQQEW